MRWPLGCQNAEPGRDVVEAVQVKLDAQPAVVALLCLGPSPEVALELFVRRPDRSINALEHRFRLVAAPVGAADGEELERPEPACRRDMGTLAQVAERAVLVERGDRRRLVGRSGLGCEVVEDLDLVRLTLASDDGPGFAERHLATDERLIGLDALGHPRLDGLEVLGRERAGHVEVVVEAVVDGRPDAKLGAGKRSRTASAMTCAAEWRIAPRSSCAPASSSSSAEPRSGASKNSSSGGPSSATGACWSAIVPPPENHATSRPAGTRGRSPAVPPAFAARQLPSRRARGRANGRRPGRFAGRSRVVHRGEGDRRAHSLDPALWGASRRPCPDRRILDMVGDTGLEPVTSCMSSKCSNQLS